jgi:rare lipoprotein A
MSVVVTAAASASAQESAPRGVPDSPVATSAPAQENSVVSPTVPGPEPGDEGDEGVGTPSVLPKPSALPGTVELGVASVYAAELEGRPTASGATYDSQKFTAAHRSLPFGSRIRVTDAVSGKSLSVTVNDRWSGGPGQIVNLSRRAADELGFRGHGQRKVEITVEMVGDGKRQRAAGASTSQLLPERIEATSGNRADRARGCGNEADILGLREALWESHVRNCLVRKRSKSAPDQTR